ncbi:hypothetical protein [Maribacter polysaccharolyticus]|uniref:hypothetical protein n=1 Tax=Maribacter polysaccharolyticus TaxID=3020831 RepID=UPI00237FC9AA|nr:hypothetical protein [Maribacter polysaccharolyticus]MDE3743755.1 hypothetical protein [Maribacter polysaccharolyticus]
MKTNSKLWITVLILVVVGFSIGIYLQDLKHQQSTEAAWQANRFNIKRFNKIRNYNLNMNPSNWRFMRDSIEQQFDSLMILRFRKEMDSLYSQNQ